MSASVADGERASARRIVAVLGTTFLLNQYDMALLGLALPQIQRDLAIPDAGTGPFLGAVRLGMVAALGLALAADRAGRRSLLLWTIAGFAGATTLSAFAPNASTFGVLQFVARACIGAEEVIAIVFVAEELPAALRGRGFGALAIFGAVGHGLAAIAYGFVESLPYGWRALYLLGALPFPLLWWIRRRLPESRRFVRASARTHPAKPWDALIRLARARTARLAALLGAIVAFGAASAAALSFVSKTLQEVHGYAPADVTLLVVGGGTIALAAYPLAGALSDRWGRRPVLVAALGCHAAGACAFYGLAGPVLVPAWMVMMSGFMAADVLLGAIGTEIFPTVERATASGLRMVALAAGGALGLAAEGLAYDGGASHADSILHIVPAALVAAVLVVAFLPETAARELEEITPE